MWEEKGGRNLCVCPCRQRLSAELTFSDGLQRFRAVCCAAVSGCVPRGGRAGGTACLCLRLPTLSFIHRFCLVTQDHEILPVTLLGQLWFSPTRDNFVSLVNSVTSAELKSTRVLELVLNGKSESLSGCRVLPCSLARRIKCEIGQFKDGVT